MDQYSDMEIGFSQTCSGCRRTFAQLTAFSNHLANCTQKKRKLADALTVVQGLYRNKKRHRLENSEKKVEPCNQSPPCPSGSTLPDTSVRKFAGY
jgi:hypothetical protein